MKKLSFILILFGAVISWAQIAPECAGIEKPADYNEEKQQAFMQNHFMSMFLPLPSIDAHPSDHDYKSIGLDTTYVPKLTCRQRLALNATKTEDANKTPLLPRIRVGVPLFRSKIFSIVGEVSFIPPLPIPHMSIWHVTAEGSFFYEPITRLILGARTFMGLSYLRAEVATPFEKGAPIKDDWFSFAIIGADLSLAFGLPLTENQKLYPSFSFGLIKGASNFVVADDGVSVPNKYPLFCPTTFMGISYHLFDRFRLSLLAGGAWETAITGHFRFAYMF